MCSSCSASIHEAEAAQMALNLTSSLTPLSSRRQQSAVRVIKLDESGAITDRGTRQLTKVNLVIGSANEIKD